MVISHVHFTPLEGQMDGMARGSLKFEPVACGRELNFRWHTCHQQLL
jgi:hypothetical protein